MRVSFRNNLIDRIFCWICNKYEEFTHWYWHKSPHHVTCEICGETMHSNVDKYSPEECGWRNIKGGSSWICHRCDAHRNYTMYSDLVDLDEEIVWCRDSDKKNELINKRKQLLEELKEWNKNLL